MIIDQVMVGKFIAQKRKEINLTQENLAQQLGLTNKAVSKWECGKCLPDAMLMKPLSEILGITVNELLSGECLNETHKEQVAEDITIKLTKVIEGMRKQKRMIIFMVVGLLVMIMGERLPELLLIDNVAMKSQFNIGVLDGISTGLLIVGIALFAAGIALYIKDIRKHL